MVFFAFHHYLAKNFTLNNFFFAGNYISVLFATWNDILYFVSNISQVILVIFCGCLCYTRKKPFRIYGKKNPSHKAIWLKFRSSFTKSLTNLIMSSICEKMRLQQLRKAKYSILAPILHLIPTSTIHCVNLMIFLYLALNLETFFKKGDFLE